MHVQGIRRFCIVCDKVLDGVNYDEYSPELPLDMASQDNTSYPRVLQLLNLCKTLVHILISEEVRAVQYTFCYYKKDNLA